MSNKVIFLSLLALILVVTSAFSKTETFVNPFTGKTEDYETIDGWKEPAEKDTLQIEKTEKQQIQEFEAKALKGDYQAQRNTAYMYSTSKDPFTSNKLLGCAWYKLILLSGSSQVGDGDIGNVQTYCGRLSPEQQAVTDQQALRLYREIYQEKPRKKARGNP